MEIKVLITKQNKEKVLKLIDELVECEAEATAVASNQKEILSSIEPSQSASLIKEIPKGEGINVAEVEVQQKKFGSWGMFNSYVPGKAALRVLLHLMDKNDGKPVKYSDLVDECVVEFWKAGLRYRGFPKKTSESAKGRLAMHIIWPFYEMGLIRVFKEEGNQTVAITRDGLEFAHLPNPLLDQGAKEKGLSSEEREWLLAHLKKIDEKGYKELTVFEDLVAFLSKRDRSFGDIVNYLQANKEFESWTRQGSRYKDNPKAFARQLHNISTTFASGKIALLRELGVLSTSRATYQVLRNLEA